jgi:hypothetical protein
MPMRRWGRVLVVLGAVAASGCSVFGGGAQKFACPVSFVAPDADKVAVFKPGEGRQLEDVSYGVQVAGVESKCNRVEKGLVVDTKVNFRLVSNDSSVRKGSVTYFVSVVDGQQNILIKRTYVLPFEFDTHERNMAKSDDLIEKLPLLNVATGASYAIVVGLQLTPEQLNFNRSSAHTTGMPVSPSQPVAPTSPSVAPANGS